MKCDSTVVYYLIAKYEYMICKFSLYVAAVFIIWGQAKHFYQYNQWSFTLIERLPDTSIM